MEIYYSTVSAIAHGYNRLSSIFDYADVQRTHLPKHLRIPVDLEYIGYVRLLFSKRS